MDNVAQTIVSQYANSPTIGQLIASLNDWIDPGADVDALYENLWNLDTASGYGLDVLGRIVGVSRILQVENSTLLGFKEALPGSGTLNHSTFYSGGSATSARALSDAAFRSMVAAKALANICDGSIPAINRVLLTLFPNRGNCYCTDGLDMTMTYTFSFPITPVELAIVTNSGVLPRPSGIYATVVHP